MELAQFLKNNSVVFSAVYLSSGNWSADIQYLCETTGGRGIHLFSPKGARDLREALSKYRPATYVLRYRSRSDSEFGRRYIELQTEVNLQSKSGYDEGGYFAPLQY